MSRKKKQGLFLLLIMVLFLVGVMDLKAVYKAGAFSAVCGTAITRPMDITKRFVKALGEE